MRSTKVHVLDLNFQGHPQTIAAYLIPYSGGAILIESGPGSTKTHLESGLNDHGFSVKDVTDLFVTHIHLDHAGAAGWLAQQGTRVHVHPRGAPHLINPEKLLFSATRIYGDQMDTLWGEFLPVPEAQISIPEDGDTMWINEIKVHAIDTPGHANHHYTYVVGDIAFTGDVGGVRIPGIPHVRVPMPPPELHLPRWKESIKKLQALQIERIAPTHFGIYDDPVNHLKMMEDAVNDAEAWIEKVMPNNPNDDALRQMVMEWADQRSSALGISPEAVELYELANPTGMSAAGIARYWQRYRTPRED